MNPNILYDHSVNKIQSRKEHHAKYRSIKNDYLSTTKNKELNVAVSENEWLAELEDQWEFGCYKL